jgi:putative hydrolase of the HAD superfamily
MLFKQTIQFPDSQKGYLDFISDLLTSLKPLEPIETGVLPKFHKNGKVEAVVFDIYGTLLISASGDIDQAEMSEKNLERALKEAGIKIIDNSGSALTEILKDFENTVSIIHDSYKKNDIPHPEIDILSVWEIVLIHAKRNKLVDYTDDADIMRMTCVFEFLSNQVYPMPNMKKVISAIKKKGIPLGIVSNAQFYTPVIMNYMLNGKFELTEKIKGFKKTLTVFSYKFGRAKPDAYLFAEVSNALQRKFKINPENVLFVGNDMLKDIYPSAQEGFKTVLFAGDKRSLRMRENHEKVKLVVPDYIITDLVQLLEII